MLVLIVYMIILFYVYNVIIIDDYDYDRRKYYNCSGYYKGV